MPQKINREKSLLLLLDRVEKRAIINPAEGNRNDSDPVVWRDIRVNCIPVFCLLLIIGAGYDHNPGKAGAQTRHAAAKFHII